MPVSTVMEPGIRRSEAGCLDESTCLGRIDLRGSAPYLPALPKDRIMKIANSLKTLKKRDKNCRVVRRKGRVYVINKVNPRFKARQG